MARSGIYFNVKFEGLAEFKASYKLLPKIAQKEVRRGNLQIAKNLVTRIKVDAAGEGPQASIVIPTIRATSAATPTILAGKKGAEAGDVLAGSVFGSNKFAQFQHRHLGTEGYYFFSTVERNKAYLTNAYSQLMQEVLERAGL